MLMTFLMSDTAFFLPNEIIRSVVLFEKSMLQGITMYKYPALTLQLGQQGYIHERSWHGRCQRSIQPMPAPKFHITQTKHITPFFKSNVVIIANKNHIYSALICFFFVDGGKKPYRWAQA